MSRCAYIFPHGYYVSAPACVYVRVHAWPFMSTVLYLCVPLNVCVYYPLLLVEHPISLFVLVLF